MTKKTSQRVSKIASGLLEQPGLLAADRDRKAVHDAIRACGLPLSQNASNSVVAAIDAALEPLFRDVRALAGSCLSQDEEPAGNDSEA